MQATSASQRVKRNSGSGSGSRCVLPIHMQCGHGIPDCPAYGYLSTEDVGKVGGTGNMGSMVKIWGNEKKERQEV